MWLLAVLIPWLICRLIGALVNHLAGRPLMNWWAWFGGYSLTVYAGLTLWSFWDGMAGMPYAPAVWILPFLVPGVVGTLLGWRWRKKHPLDRSGPTA